MWAARVSPSLDYEHLSQQQYHHLRKHFYTVNGSDFTNSFAMIALSVTLACASLLRLQDNAYTGVVVGIGHSVPESEGPTIINGIKEMFTEASPLLHKATWGKASFSDITILVPKSWSSYETATFQTFKEAHVRVDKPSPNHGNAPYTQQSKGCGEQGDFIHFTPEFFLNNATMVATYGSPGKVLVHEWSHFRYGVFDEYGYPGDRLFPHVYWDENAKAPRPTGCNNSVIQGNDNFHFPECQIDPSTGQYSRQCWFRPSLSPMPQVTSSLMYMHFLSDAGEFCEEHNHNRFAPNKQNAMCDGKSIGEVVRRHTDFENVDSAPMPRIPIFRILKSPETKYFVILDSSSGMNLDQRYSFVRTAFTIFLEHIPERIGMGLLTFDNTIISVKPVAPLDLKWLTQLMNIISERPSSNAASWSVILDSIREGQKRLGKGGTLILITAGSSKTMTENDRWSFRALCSQLKENGTKVTSILYSFSDRTTAFSAILAELAEKTNGKNYYVYEQPPIGHYTYPKVLTQLVSAMSDIAGGQGEDEDSNFVVVKQTTHYGKDVSSEFYVDQSSANNMTIMFVPDKQDDVDYQKLKVIDPSGKIYTRENLEFRKSTALSEMQIQNVMPGLWRYEIQMFRFQSSRLSISVQVLTYPSRDKQPIRIRGWTNVGSTPVNATTMPVIIYAEVKQGYSPIRNARVVARVQRPRPFNGNVTMDNVTLLDNGNGEPDVTKGDGIYSRYYTNFVNITEGHYLVTIFVDDGEGAAEVVTNSPYGSHVLPVDPETPYCCGSQSTANDAIPTGNFSRATNVGTFLVIQPPPPGDHSPPSRIGDLRVKNFEPQKWQMTLEWTAPGNDRDQGMASYYEMRYSNSSNFLLNHFDQATPLSGIPPPLQAGTVQQLDVSHSQDFEPMIFYYAMRAVDGENNKGRISNVVTVQFLSILPPTAGPTTVTVSHMPTVEPKPTEVARSAVVAIIVGCVVGVLLIVILLVIVILWHMRRRKAREAAASGKANSMKPPIFLSPPVKVVENGDKKNNTANGQAHSLDKALSPVQFMSASELLERHEMQKAQARSATPSLQGETDSNAPLNTVLPSDNYGITYPVYGQQPLHGLFVPAIPYRENGSIDRGSLSDKHSSSLHSGSTNELRRDNGYFTSFEETSEDSNGVRHAVPTMLPSGPMTSSKTSLARKTVAESQV